MSDKETPNLDVEAGLLRVACERLLKDGGEVMIRPGLTIMKVNNAAVVDSGQGYAELEDVGAETASEIVEAANKEARQEREEEDAEYLDPDKNPFIRTGPED